MRGRIHRPAGIVALSIILMLGGLAALLESFDLAVTLGRNWPFVLLSVVTSLILLHRAYRLWFFQRRAWLTTTLTLAVKGGSSALLIVNGRPSPTSWLALTLAIIGIAYLIRPQIRAFFS